MADETSFYSDQQGVTVTDKRVIVRNVTYALANITSVSTEVEQPNLSGPVLFVVIGVASLVLFSANTQNGFLIVVGLCLIVLGVIWYRGSKPTWHLKISSASGEATPLQSANEQWIRAIVQAINEAMIRRT